jgi:hypothetical protein
MNKKKSTYISNVVITKPHANEIHHYTNEAVSLIANLEEERGREKSEKNGKNEKNEKHEKSEKSTRSLSPVAVKGISTIEIDTQEPMAVYGVELGELSPFSDVPGSLSPKFSKIKQDIDDNFKESSKPHHSDVLSSNQDIHSGNKDLNDNHDRMSNFHDLNSNIKSNLIDHNNPSGGFLLSKYVRDIGKKINLRL